jgi:hypothetical protein
VFSTHNQLQGYDDVLLTASNCAALTTVTVTVRVCGPVAGHCTTLPVTAI